MIKLPIHIKPKYYSTNGVTPVVPEKSYANADLQKLEIIKENKGKAGIYRWMNLINGKSYVGSSADLGKRLRNYFNLDYLELAIQKNQSLIYRSVLKSGYSSFSLEILEYCSPEKCLEREQYYLDLLKPEYNLLKTAGSSLGFKHSADSQIFSHLKCLNSSAKHQEHLKRLNLSPEHQEHLKRIQLQRSTSVVVLDMLNNEKTVYTSIREAARAIGVTHNSIYQAFKSKPGESSVFVKKKRYQVTKFSTE